MKTQSISLKQIADLPSDGYHRRYQDNTKEQLEDYVTGLCNKFLEYKRKEEQVKNQLERILKEYHSLIKKA